MGGLRRRLPAGGSAPDFVNIDAVLSAGGLTADTPRPLKLKRLPDQPLEAVTIACSSPRGTTGNGTANYAWTAAFRVGVKDLEIQVRQTLQVQEAWLGKHVTFDATADAAAAPQTWAYVKQSAGSWVYWKTADSSWAPLPRAIGSYTVVNTVFVKSGTDYVNRKNASNKWPEAFVRDANYDTKKADWMTNIHDSWDGRFRLKNKDCPADAPGLCSWDIEFKCNWDDNGGDKKIYAISAQAWERSNASDWYLSEDRLGVAGHECGHLLAAYDEYTGGATDPADPKIEPDSLMGQNLNTSEPRHLNGFRDKMKEKINGWIGRDWNLEIVKR